MTPSRSFYLAMVLLAIAAWTAPSQWRSIQGLADTWWWPATSGSLILVSAIGFRWMERAKDASPMQFVAAVNGTTFDEIRIACSDGSECSYCACTAQDSCRPGSRRA